jgi:uncharacterized protein
MSRVTESLSIQQARKLVLLSQRVPPQKHKGSALEATLSAIENLGYIQIDTISVIERAHHHTLWNRNPRYNSSHLELLLSDKQIFEYWSHAAAYLPMRDYRYSLIRKQAIASGEEKHWYDLDRRLMLSVLKRIEQEGPLMAKDFEHKGKKTEDWTSKPARRALEYLFMQGELMIHCRKKFHKVYDLTERVIPKNTDCSLPSPKEYARFLISRYLNANGLGQAAEIGYLLKNTKPLISECLQEMNSNSELIQINVGGNNYFALPSSLELLEKTLPYGKLKILSPFDNLLIQRKRMLALFNFDYQIECYVPESKRKFGYFSLPILWDGRLIARMDCKADRKNSLLHIKYLAIESGLVKTDAFAHALSKELKPFLQFNKCYSLRLHTSNPPGIKPTLEKALNELMSIRKSR